MPLLPQFGDSENNLIAKIAINTGPNPPTRGDGRWNLLYKVCQNTYESAMSGSIRNVRIYSDLPIDINNPSFKSIYLVRESSGIPLINFHEAGLYIRVTNNGELSDWIKA
jgi:hypothetical protein